MSSRAATTKRAAAHGDVRPPVLKAKLQPVLDQLAAIETALAPYEATKQQLAEARARYRKLTDEFVDELKGRCSAVKAKDYLVFGLRL